MSTISEKQTKAIDLSHHLSVLSRARQASPLKELFKGPWIKPGLISLAGGTPHPAYFPFQTLEADVLNPDSFALSKSSDSAFSWFWNLFGNNSNKLKTKHITIQKYPENPDDINLAVSLQYGTATGIPQLQAVMREVSANVFQPAYTDWVALIHCGNTDGWNKVVMTLCNPGDSILTSHWTYPSALASASPFHVKAVPIEMDGQGMRADDLRRVLSEWDEEARGTPRPHVMYTVPVGQNPTGSTMYGERKKAIYDICIEFDVIIVEDDPYYFIQQGEYIPKHERANFKDESLESNDKFIASLAPSYLKFDYQGRVIRLDTFSKTIAPGSRLGWFTCNPMFAERLERQAETSSQSASGFSQAMVASLISSWKHDGYIRWVRGIKAQYTERRDSFIDCLAEVFDLRLDASGAGFRAGCAVYNAYPKAKRGLSEKTSINDPALLSFVPPTSGMFVWMKIHFENHPSFATEGTKALEMRLWIKLAEAGVLFGPGSMFHATPYTDEISGDGHFRCSFSMLTHEEMKKAAEIFGGVIKKFMKTL